MVWVPELSGVTEAHGDKTLRRRILMLSRQITVVRSTCGEERVGPASCMRNFGDPFCSAVGDVAVGKAVYPECTCSWAPLGSGCCEMEAESRVCLILYLST